MGVMSLAALGLVVARTGSVWERLGLGHGAALLPFGESVFRRWCARLEGVLAGAGVRALRAGAPEEVLELLSWELRSYRELPRSFYMIDGRGVVHGARLDADGDAALAARAALEEGVSAEVAHQGGALRVADGVEGRLFLMASQAPGRDVALLGCDGCGHVGTREVMALRAPRRVGVPIGSSAYETVTTPGATTVAEVARQLRVRPEAILKTMVLDIDGRTFVAVLPGNRQLNLTKCAALAGGRHARLADAEVVSRLTGAPLGWAGPVGLRAPILADLAVHDGPWVTGGNAVDAHFRGVVAGVHFDRDVVGDVTYAEPGDDCPRCGEGRLGAADGAIVGWVRGPVVRPGGKGIAGARGVVVPWLTQFEIEAQALFRGLVGAEAPLRWGRDLAPADVWVVALDREAGEVAAEALAGAGMRVMVDDRDERAGAKLQFSDEVGIAPRVVAGRRFREDGFEVRVRLGAEPRRVGSGGLVGVVTEARAAV